MSQNIIRMITFHTPKNYGAVLQAFSLMSCLKTYSGDVKVIDFNTPNLRSLYPLYTKPTTIKQAAHWALNAGYLGKKKRKYEKFEKFVREKLDLTRRYESFGELKKTPPAADIYVTGSDQVFNPNRIEEERQAFYLHFGREAAKRISYAASFGVKSVPEERRQELSDYLTAFSSLSVREESGTVIVRELSGRAAQEVLDPVFLNDRDFWREVSEPYPVGDEPYLLYYRLMSSKQSDDAVRRAADEKKLRLIVVTDGRLKWRADRVLRDVGPEELLYLFDHAQYVATDSFHGVAFSLLFEKQFLFADYNEKLADRGLNLMKKAGADHCAGLNGNDGNAVLDYEAVKQNLMPLIAASKAFLENAISGSKD